MTELTPIPYAGAVDADGHIMEPPGLWEEYIDPAYRARAIRLCTNAEGVEYWEVDRKHYAPFSPVHDGVGGELPRSMPGRYADRIPFGAADPAERLKVLDQYNLERSVLFPGMELTWECVVTDPGLTYAYQRAYNRWIADFCRDSGGRLVPVAHLSLIDVDLAVAELERAVSDGCRGAFMVPFTHTRVPHGNAKHDRIWAAAQDLGVPVMIHPTIEPRQVDPHANRFDFSESAGTTWYYIVLARQRAQQAFLTFFSEGTLERFPRLQIGVLESQAGWIESFLERMDSLARTSFGDELALVGPPSDYFRRQCFISCDPDEHSLARIIDTVGAQCFVWASDFPHSDHSADFGGELEELAGLLSDEDRTAFLGQNATRIFGLE